MLTKLADGLGIESFLLFSDTPQKWFLGSYDKDSAFIKFVIFYHKLSLKAICPFFYIIFKNYEDDFT